MPLDYQREQVVADLRSIKHIQSSIGARHFAYLVLGSGLNYAYLTWMPTYYSRYVYYAQYYQPRESLASLIALVVGMFLIPLVFCWIATLTTLPEKQIVSPLTLQLITIGFLFLMYFEPKIDFIPLGVAVFLLVMGYVQDLGVVWLTGIENRGYFEKFFNVQAPDEELLAVLRDRKLSRLLGIYSEKTIDEDLKAKAFTSFDSSLVATFRFVLCLAPYPVDPTQTRIAVFAYDRTRDYLDCDDSCKAEAERNIRDLRDALKREEIKFATTDELTSVEKVFREFALLPATVRFASLLRLPRRTIMVGVAIGVILLAAYTYTAAGHWSPESVFFAIVGVLTAAVELAQYLRRPRSHV